MDGSEIWISLSTAISPDNGYEVEGIIEDISDRKRLEKALAEKAEAVRRAEKLESIGRFIGVVLDGLAVHLGAGYPVDIEGTLELMRSALAPK
jgi:hypothetical protein